MDTPARLLRLLALFSTRPTWRADELAERLEITTRTLRRDVGRLRDLGYPIDATTGRYGGYSLGRGGKLPPLLLSEDEAVAVSLALRDLSRLADATIGEAALSSLTKLLQIMPTGLAQRVEALGEMTESGTRSSMRPGGPIDLATLLAAAVACRRGERVAFTYEPFERDPSQRRAEPHRLVSFNRKWYLVAFDLDRDDWRTFRLDRISAFAGTGHRTTPGRQAPDVVDLVQEGVTIRAYEIESHIRVHAPLDCVVADVPPAIGVCEPTDDPGITLLRLGGDVAWIAHLLTGLPYTFDVVSPDEVRHEVAAIGRRLAERHRG